MSGRKSFDLADRSIVRSSLISLPSFWYNACKIILSSILIAEMKTNRKRDVARYWFFAV